MTVPRHQPGQQASQTIADAPLLLGRYRPLRILARGGSSSVYRGRDETLGRDVAIKLFNAGAKSDVRKQREELRLLAGLSHHGVVSVIDAGIDDSTPTDPRPFIVMELVRGITVSQAIIDRQLSAREIGEIGFEIAEVLEYIHHRGVIHRDITPSNIMLVDYGTQHSRPRARLTDFGISIDNLSRASEPIELLGTIAYLSPEQALNEPLGPASDIYSLGLVLIECFTREIVFPGTPVASAVARMTHDPVIPPGVDTRLSPILASMTRREPGQRPTAGELIETLRAALRAPSD
jgi:eukaryotic-like serine/threonine-protein kinase